MFLLQSTASVAASDTTDIAESNRHLFAYLAQEVSSELPADLQDFVLRCSILIELNPTMCAALTVAAMPQWYSTILYRRNLFLTAIDERCRCCAFTICFGTSSRGAGASRSRAEARAARAGGERRDVDVARDLSLARRRSAGTKRCNASRSRARSGLRTAAIATVERWIDTIPETKRAKHPMIAYLRGVVRGITGTGSAAEETISRRAVEGLTGAGTTRQAHSRDVPPSRCVELRRRCARRRESVSQQASRLALGSARKGGARDASGVVRDASGDRQASHYTRGVHRTSSRAILRTYAPRLRIAFTAS